MSGNVIYENLEKYPYHRLELKLVNGNKVIETMTWCRIYDLEENFRLVLKFDVKFPYVHLTKKPYVFFRYADSYNSIISRYEDSKYKVDCPLEQLLSMFNVQYKSWDESVMMASIEGKEIDN